MRAQDNSENTCYHQERFGEVLSKQSRDMEQFSSFQQVPFN